MTFGGFQPMANFLSVANHVSWPTLLDQEQMHFIDGSIPNVDELQALWQQQCSKLNIPASALSNSLAGLLWALAVQHSSFGRSPESQKLIAALVSCLAVHLQRWVEQSPDSPVQVIVWEGGWEQQGFQRNVASHLFKGPFDFKTVSIFAFLCPLCFIHSPWGFGRWSWPDSKLPRSESVCGQGVSTVLAILCAAQDWQLKSRTNPNLPKPSTTAAILATAINSI